MKGVNHYTKDGSVHKGPMHKMDDGKVSAKQEYLKCLTTIWQKI